MLWLEQGQGEEAARRNRPPIMVTTMPTNMADVAKRPGAARDAATNRDRAAVMLTSTEIKGIERVLGAKAQIVVRALRAAGMIGGESCHERQRRKEPTLRPSG